jgi:hypothetical protein
MGMLSLPLTTCFRCKGHNKGARRLIFPHHNNRNPTQQAPFGVDTDFGAKSVKALRQPAIIISSHALLCVIWYSALRYAREPASPRTTKHTNACHCDHAGVSKFAAQLVGQLDAVGEKPVASEQGIALVDRLTCVPGCTKRGDDFDLPEDPYIALCMVHDLAKFVSVFQSCRCPMGAVGVEIFPALERSDHGLPSGLVLAWFAFIDALLRILPHRLDRCIVGVPNTYFLEHEPEMLVYQSFPAVTVHVCDFHDHGYISGCLCKAQPDSVG